MHHNKYVRHPYFIQNELIQVHEEMGGKGNSVEYGDVSTYLYFRGKPNEEMV